MHAWGYASALQNQEDASIGFVWDDVVERGEAFASQCGAIFGPDRDAVIQQCDALILTSENMSHIDHLEACAKARKPVLCEKPIIGSEQHIERLEALIAADAKIMTAFPCRYSPAFVRLCDRVRSGEIGQILSVCATNRGRCPFDWFVEKEKSGGGAMIDHVVHVADLLSVLLGKLPSTIRAQTGSNMCQQEWEDTAMLTLDYENGTFATLDSSWSFPQGYKTWGDVTLNIVGEKGVIELDMFGQGMEMSAAGKASIVGFGSDLDALLVADFVRFVNGEIECPIPAQAGLDATQIAFQGYRSTKLMAV